MPPAARVTDNVAHPLPPVLNPGPGSPNVLIGYLPAWRGVPAAVASVLQAAKKISDAAIQAAEAATLAAAGTPGAPAAKAAEETAKSTAAASMGSMVTSMAGGADIHACTTPLPVPPHGPGVVIDGSPTVLINNLPACRLGDTILEPVGPPNKIVKGEPTVIIGQSGSGAGGSSSSGSAGTATATPPETAGEAKYQPASGGPFAPVVPSSSTPPAGSTFSQRMQEARETCSCFTCPP
ncbi:MAG: PAAR domain-containing protein [Acidobacteria bacterium]|nr:PAAR domain-containing protein [Acidobacteriota bacterium]